MQETGVLFLGREDPLEKEMATTPVFLRIPWTEERSGLQSIGSQRVGHDWSDLACIHALLILWSHFDKEIEGKIKSMMWSSQDHFLVLLFILYVYSPFLLFIFFFLV